MKELMKRIGHVVWAALALIVFMAIFSLAGGLPNSPAEGSNPASWLGWVISRGAILLIALAILARMVDVLRTLGWVAGGQRGVAPRSWLDD